ncbi:MAG: SusC/RagA family TonB-linked outer membrane protein [Bacteroidetes bacterium]|nr:SusC/RagA family TonB-linked outer membrane protein [Bacteroidota bacterium]
MRRLLAILLSLAMSFLSANANADPGNNYFKKITGKVFNSDGSPLSGATVNIKGTTTSVTTDATGAFSIDLPDNSPNPTLVISAVGYGTREVSAKNTTHFDIVLDVDIKKLSDVVVVGYGTRQRKDLTGSIASVSAAQIEQRPVSSYEDALAGTVPGIDVAPRSAKPGNISEITIRGIGTISGDREPLFVIDGFPTDANNAAAINPANILSIDVLKDASSTAIYGSRGANGVVIITTKSGKSGLSKVDVSLKTGFAKANKHDFYKTLNGAEYTEWYKEKAQFNGDPIPSWITNWDGTSTNWQDLIYRTAPFRDYNLTVSGGSDKLSYMFSGGFLNQDDILLNAGYDLYSARIKMDYHASKKITIGINLAPSFTVQRLSAPEDDFSALAGAALLLPPIIPAYNKDGTPSDPNSFGILNKAMANPLTIAANYHQSNKNFYLLSNAYVQVDILKGLSFKSSIGADLTDANYRLFQAQGLNGQALYPVTALELSNTRTLNWLNENTLNYKKTFAEDHKLELLAGYTVQKVDFTQTGANANTFSSNLAQTIGFGANQSAYSGATGNTLLSYLARANYSYKDRYLLTATIRRDGSSRFGANKLWGVFPSVAAAWNLSNEDFMSSVRAIDHAKIRASYGISGSNFIGDFTSKSSLVSINHSFGANNVVGYVNGDPGNPNLSWEKSKQLDLGLDLGLCNRVSATFDYFSNTSDGLLLNVNVPTSTGYSGDLENIGSMRKWGLELSANANIIKKKDFGWDIGFNVTHLRQKVLKLGPTGAPLYQFFAVLETRIGGPLEQEHALQQTGILSQADINNPKVAKKAVGDKAGDYKFLDANNDGFIDAFNGNDGVLVGDNNPRWLYGINTSLRYKNFRLTALLQGQQGAKMLDFVYQIMSLHTYNTNMDHFFYDGRYISESNPGNGHTPRAGYNDVGAVSSWEVQKTDYLRIRNINLSYTFPTDLSRKLLVNDLRAYVSVENLYTFKQYRGGNPQAVRNGFDTQIFGDHKTLGLNSVATAPLPRIFTLGINFSF